MRCTAFCNPAIFKWRFVFLQTQTLLLEYVSNLFVWTHQMYQLEGQKRKHYGIFPFFLLLFQASQSCSDPCAVVTPSTLVVLWPVVTRGAQEACSHPHPGNTRCCITVQLYNCSTVQMCNCTTVQLYKCATVQLYNCTTVQLCNCTTLQLYNCPLHTLLYSVQLQSTYFT